MIVWEFGINWEVKRKDLVMWGSTLKDIINKMQWKRCYRSLRCRYELLGIIRNAFVFLFQSELSSPLKNSVACIISQIIFKQWTDLITITITIIITTTTTTTTTIIIIIITITTTTTITIIITIIIINNNNNNNNIMLVLLMMMMMMMVTVTFVAINLYFLSAFSLESPSVG